MTHLFLSKIISQLDLLCLYIVKFFLFFLSKGHRSSVNGFHQNSEMKFIKMYCTVHVFIMAHVSQVIYTMLSNM